MSNRNRRIKKKEMKNKYNSWIAVIVFSILDPLFTITIGHTFIELTDFSEKLGEKGKKRQDILHLVLWMTISSIFFLMCIRFVRVGRTALWGGIFLSGISLLISICCIVNKRIQQ